MDGNFEIEKIELAEFNGADCVSARIPGSRPEVRASAKAETVLPDFGCRDLNLLESRL